MKFFIRYINGIMEKTREEFAKEREEELKRARTQVFDEPSDYALDEDGDEGDDDVWTASGK